MYLLLSHACGRVDVEGSVSAGNCAPQWADGVSVWRVASLLLAVVEGVCLVGSGGE